MIWSGAVGAILLSMWKERNARNSDKSNFLDYICDIVWFNPSNWRPHHFNFVITLFFLINMIPGLVFHPLFFREGTFCHFGSVIWCWHFLQRYLIHVSYHKKKGFLYIIMKK